MGDEERDKQMVHDLLELKDKVEKIIGDAFQNDEKFHDVIRVSAVSFKIRTLNTSNKNTYLRKNFQHTCMYKWLRRFSCFNAIIN